MCLPTRPRHPLMLASLLGLVLAAAPLLLAARPAVAATTFVVTTTGDNPDADLADDRCDTTPGPGAPCSLRAAIQEANATPGPDTIRFNIPGPPDQVKTIRPASPLPNVLAKVTIDGYTQPGASPNTARTGTNAVLTIELDGSNAGLGAAGLRFLGANSLVRGLVVNRFDNIGVAVGNGAIGVRVQGCFIGTDATGTAARGTNLGVTVVRASATQIGGSGPAARNLIAGNAGFGVYVIDESPGTRILGNLIGTDRTGAAPLGNGRDGVHGDSSGTIIGGADAGDANVIAFNGEHGVGLFGGAGIRILRNTIFGNTEQGIDLDGDGPTANDPLDADAGPNTLQNFPVITSAAGSSVQGTLNSTPNQDFVLRLFSNPGPGDEGEVFEDGPLVVTTDANGDATFVFTPDPPIPAGRTVTATATNQGGSTSEFSAAVPITAS